MRRCIQITLLVWVHQHLLKRVTPEEYSLLPIVTAIMAFFPILSTILSSGLSRAVTAAVAQGDDEQVIRITSSVLPMLIAGAFFVIGIGVMLAFNLDSFVRIPTDRLIEAQLMLILMVCSFAYALVVSIYQTAIHVQQQYVLANVIGLIAQMLKLSLLFGLLTFVGARVVFVVIATTAATFAEHTAIAFISRRLLKTLRFQPRAFNWATAREIVSFGGWISCAQVGGLIYRSADPILLNRFATPIDVACFSIGSLAQRHLQPLVAAATLPITPVMVAMHATGDRHGLTQAFCRLNRYSMWGVGFVVAPFVIASDEFFRLYLADSYALYSNSRTVMMFTLASMILSYAVNNGLDKAAMAMGRVKIYVILIISTQLFNLFLTILFVIGFKLGAIGSAMASCGAWLLFAPLGYLPLALRLIKMDLTSYMSQSFLPGLTPMGAAIGFGLAWRYFYAPSDWISLFLLFGCMSFFYLLILLLFSMPTNERQVLKDLCFAKTRILFNIQKHISY